MSKKNRYVEEHAAKSGSCLFLSNFHPDPELLKNYFRAQVQTELSLKLTRSQPCQPAMGNHLEFQQYKEAFHIEYFGIV